MSMFPVNRAFSFSLLLGVGVGEDGQSRDGENIAVL